MQEYYVPTNYSEVEFIEKRSRFIGQIWRVSSEEEARVYIEETQKRYNDATHCWCYRIKESTIERYTDGHEPHGTAGLPMLSVFQREEITNVLCVVSRYFGGIHLGANGLVRAYGRSAKEALDAAGVSVVRKWIVLEIPCSYAQFETVRRELAAWNGIVEEINYGADVLISSLIPEENVISFSRRLIDISAGTIEVIESGEELKAAPVKRHCREKMY